MNGYLLNVLRIAFSVFPLLALTGCCGEVFRGSNDVVGVSIAPTNSSIQPGTTQNFTATGTFAVNGGTGDITTQTTWTSSDTTIVTIDNTGLAKGIKFGTVTIAGSCQCYTSKTNLTVSSNAVSLTSIAVTPANATVKAGLTQQFTATGTYSNGTTNNITSSAVWSSSDSTVATISSSGGLATGVAAGSATITATSGSVSGQTTLTVQ